MVINDDRVDKNKTKKPVKSLFLTYHGLMRVLIVSRNKNAEKFSRWGNNEIIHDATFIEMLLANRILLVLLRQQIAAV